MTKSNMLVAIVGPSGSGKTKVATFLEEQFGWTQIESYTNRPKRSKNERGHIFIKEKDVSKIKKTYKDIVADDMFDGNYYFATKEQVDNNDIYIVSPSAIPTLIESYDGVKEVKVLYITAPAFLRRIRMTRRGDTIEDANRRIEHDKEVFKDADKLADEVVANIVWSETADSVIKIINKWRSKRDGKGTRKGRH